MPTTLPRRIDKKPSLARTVFDFVFNAALVVSALILTFILLVREEQYAFGPPPSPDQAIEQTAPSSTTEMSGETRIVAPSN